MTVKGVLGDGVKFSETAYLSGESEAALYAEPYASKPERGRFGGWIVFRDNPGISDFDGKLQWRKFPIPKAARYAAGFEVEVWGMGSRYVPPLPGNRLLSQLEDRYYNAELSLIGSMAPDPGTGSLDRVMTWKSNNKLVHYGPEKLGASASAKTGTLAGSFFDPATKTKVAFTGVAFQKQGLAAGTFLNGPASGAVRILPGTAFTYPGSEDAGPLTRIEPPGSPTDDPAESQPDPLADGVLPAAAGLYGGVLLSSLDGTTPIGALEGVKLTPTGAISGTLWLEGVRFGFKGNLLLDGGVIQLSNGWRLKSSTLDLTLHLTQNVDGDGFGLGGDLAIEGTSQGDLDAQRRPLFTKLDRAPQEGAYTAVMRAPDGVDPAAEPGGDAATTLKVSFQGAVTGLVTLPEGTKASLGGHVGAAYGDPDEVISEWSFHRGLYGKKPRGYLAGKLHFHRDTADPVTALDGQWRWVKQAGAAPVALYPDGFQVTRDVIGSTYTVPAKGERAMAGLDDDWWNLWLRFAGPALSDLVPTPLDRVATWQATNRIVYFGPEAVKIAFDPKTGRLTGSYADKANGVNVKFGGVLVQSQSLVGGSYLAPSPTGPQSGLFSAQPR